MRLYLDEDCSHSLLVKLLRLAEHDVESAVEAGTLGQSDPVQLIHAIRSARIVVTKNHKHFEQLHQLISAAEGRHSGILTIRTENNPRRDLTERGIVHALRKLEASGFDLANQFYTLNDWR